MWLGRLPLAIHQRINDFIKRISANPNADYNFLNNISGLILIEKLIENANEFPRVSDLTPEQELNLFKAYLYCSQVWLDKHLARFDLWLALQNQIAEVERNYVTNLDQE